VLLKRVCEPSQKASIKNLACHQNDIAFNLITSSLAIIHITIEARLMKIKAVEIKGFRGYSSAIKIELSDLLVLVGKNDVGKSTVLEALDIFFNEGKGSIKLDKDDINKKILL